MKVLSIGSDRNLFLPDSDVARRQVKHAEKLSEFHIVVFAKKTLGFSAMKIGENVWVHPTNSFSRWLYPLDAFFLSKRFGGFDLVTAQDPFESGLAAWLASWNFNASLELQIHTDLLSPYFIRESWLNLVRVGLAKFLLPRADRVRVVSQRIADSLATAGLRLKTAPEVRPIAIDKEKIKDQPIAVDLKVKYPQFEKIILMASRLSREKNINLAIEAMSQVVKIRPNIGLIIVGSGPEEVFLKRQINRLQLENNIFFEPWLKREQIISYAKTGDLFLVTSWYEGYGLTLVEAQAAGCKIVSTDVGVAKELGAIITPYDATKLSRIILDQI